MYEKRLQIVLIPLDERPVNTRYAEMLAAIGGVDLRLPPVEIRGLQRTPADLPRLTEWLQEASVTADACIVSCEYLGYGNLINSRITNESAAVVVGRLAMLAEIGARIPVHAFSLITRVSNADDCVEEPLYWEQYGTQFYQYARLWHQAETSPTPSGQLVELEAGLPKELLADWLTRRLRNHTVNLALLDMAAREQIESLLLTSDDTAPYGFPSRERDWLRGWPALIGPSLTDRVRMYPGADEVGSALVAKLINEAAGRRPRVWIEYAIPGDEEIIAPYEDRPVRETAVGQIEACGCAVAGSPDMADFVLGVVTPSPRRTDYRPEFLELDRPERTAAYKAFLSRLGSLEAETSPSASFNTEQTTSVNPSSRGGQTTSPNPSSREGQREEEGRKDSSARRLPIAIADVAYPNGSDPLFSELLLATGCPVEPGRLAAFGAWNTAGNTLGVVVAQAALARGNPQAIEEQRKFLAHRFLEDYGYQLIVRREARADAEARWGRREPDPNSEDEQRATCAFIEKRLGELLADLRARGIGEGLAIVPGSVRLPWRRTFEVDFELA